MSSDRIQWTNASRKLSELIPWPRNPRQIKQDQAKRLAQSFDEFGQVETIAIGPDNGVYNGHQRLNVLMDKHGGDYAVEVRVASRPLTEKEREKLTVFLHKGAAGEWDFDTLSEWDVPDLIEWGFTEKELGIDFDISTEEQKEAVKKEKPQRDVDLIYTAGSFGDATEQPKHVLTHCCLAVKAGWMYGVQSTNKGLLCAVSMYQEAHQVQFIDSDYFNYDHHKHLEAIKLLKPKYCTVRDYMSEEQCKEAKIKYYSLEQVLDWAEELSEHCKNVIVIPKVDVIDKIPAKFMLGYSVPTSHGGTPLPIEAFRGRRVHLLGGSPNKQIAFWQRLPDDVVSVDNNYILKMANFGQAWFPDGRARSITEMGFGMVTNPLYIALVASLGNMAAVFWKVGAEDAQVQDGEISED